MQGDRIVAGRYRLAEVIGAGGMGAVYEATDLRLDRIVAVKLLAAAIAEQDPAAVSRFEREARAMARLTHRGIVRIFDAGRDGRNQFIVMERIDGRGLDAILRDEAPLHPGDAAATCRQVAAALAAAHAAGVVHRDLKPSNVMVAADGAARVLDFGVARILAGTTLTATASVLGTPAYMAPEQALGAPVDARADIYSLGCLLYACLTGGPPFGGDGPAAVMQQHLHAAVVAPSRHNRAVGPALDALVLSMLAKAPAARPQSAAEVAARLVTSPTAPARQRLPRPPSVARAPARRRWGVRRRRAAGLLAVAVALAAGAGAGVLATEGAAPPTSGAPRPATASHARVAASRAPHGASPSHVTTATTHGLTTTDALTPPARSRARGGAAPASAPRRGRGDEARGGRGRRLGGGDGHGHGHGRHGPARGGGAD